MSIKKKFLPIITVDKLDISAATLGTDPASRAYTTSESIAQATTLLNSALGLIDSKPSVRVALVSNVTLATPGATLDGVTMVAGDRILLTGQTVASQNGSYVWNGAAVAATRTLESNSGSKLTPQSVFGVEEGTYAQRSFRLSNMGAIVVDTTALTFVVAPLTSVPSIVGKNLQCSITTADGQVAAATGISVTPPANSMVNVLLQQYGYLTIGNAIKTGCEAFWSGDSGSTARAYGTIQSGDKVYFNGSVAGFQLDTADYLNYDYVN